MRLEEIEVIPYSLPFREPYVTARGELHERKLILVRIRGEGLEGWARPPPSPCAAAPASSRSRPRSATAAGPALLEGEVEPRRIWSAIARCRNRGRLRRRRVAAVDIALHDLVGRASGEPVWRLLGATEAAPVICNATLPAANPAATRRMAEGWAAEGFRTFKLKVGLAGDVTQVATVRQTLGDEVAIRVDANGAWSVDDAADRLEALARHQIELAEQPVGTFEQMVELRRRVEVRVAADESLVSPSTPVAREELDACDVAAVKVAKVGGLGAALEIAETIPVLPVELARGTRRDHRRGPCRAGAAARGTATPASRTASPPSGSSPRPSGAVPTAERDQLRLDERPGLGVEIDEDALAARRLD